ncbi:MAG: hypothetical protein COB67_13810 [SAR324 cluster bacterium]|uniref:SSD domain-containing protein n=1 Tax=SAR324 cluster bacterium TaxID=2024889 RepID=A0A2A4SK50_9DELT|nr:MAG: hypothetical protein COB67_13810 [SAR324 cluster bacterium]
MKIWIGRWSQAVVQYRWAVLIITAITLTALISPLLQLRFDNSSEMWFLDGDKTLSNYQEARRIFGDSQTIRVGLEARKRDKNIFNKETLAVIHEVTEFLESHEHIISVSSITNYQFMTSIDDEFSIEDLVEDVDELEGTTSETRRMTQIMTKETMAHDFLVTKDLMNTLISAKVAYRDKSIDHHIELVQQLRAFFKKNKYMEKGFDLRLGGVSAVNEQVFSSSAKDRKLVRPLMFLIIIILLYFSFRTKTGVFVPLIVVIGSIISMQGITSLLGWNKNILNANLPVLVIAVGIGDAIHIITEFYFQRKSGLAPKEAAILSVHEKFLPCFYTTVTTVAGFLAITATRLQPLREYGVIASIGVMTAFVLSVFTLPALLSFSKKDSQSIRDLLTKGPIVKLTHGLTPFVAKNRRFILAAGFVTLIISIGFMSMVKTDSSYLSYFKRDTKLQKDLNYFGDHYKNTGGMQIMIDSGENGAAIEPVFLKKVERLQSYIASLENSGKTRSLADYIQKINQSMHNDDPAYYKIPDTREHVAQYLFLYGNSGPTDDLSDLIGFHQRYLKLEVAEYYISAITSKKRIEMIEHKLMTDFPHLKVTMSGGSYMDSVKNIYLNDGLIHSFSLAIGMIILCFFIFLRSIKYGLLSLIPSIFPIIFAGGVMGVLGIELNFNTMIIAALTFGIAVDDTVHIMTCYQEGIQNGLSKFKSIDEAIKGSGHAIILTSVILFFGFGVNLIASFVPTIQFALLGGIIILVACLADLILLPAMILIKHNEV